MPWIRLLAVLKNVCWAVLTKPSRKGKNVNLLTSWFSFSPLTRTFVSLIIFLASFPFIIWFFNAFQRVLSSAFCDVFVLKNFLRLAGLASLNCNQSLPIFGKAYWPVKKVVDQIPNLLLLKAVGLLFFKRTWDQKRNTLHFNDNNDLHN